MRKGNVGKRTPGSGHARRQLSAASDVPHRPGPSGHSSQRWTRAGAAEGRRIGRGTEEREEVRKGGLGVWHKRERGRSQEVVGGACLRGRLLLLGWGIKLQERIFQVLVNLHDRGLVPTAVAVVGSREDGHGVAVVAPAIPLHDELVRTGDELEPVGVIELLRDVLPERVAGTARRDAPTAPVVRIRPEQVAHGPLVGHLLNSVELPDVVQRVKRGR
mmetsp:Transcript_61485/g.140589  ORF Transcript_61485/g.140589 Transcript_61485/m.140589 type:complete len:217 (+) Transcript_61485:95-745(+)